MKKRFILTLLLISLSAFSASAEELNSAEVQAENTTVEVLEDSLDESASAEVEAETSEEDSEEVTEQVQEKPFSVTIAINNEMAISNSGQSSVSAPLLVMNRTYVELYDMAPLLGYQVKWIPDGDGCFRVVVGDKEVDYTGILQYDDLLNKNNKFFKKNDKIYVQLRELTDLLGQSIGYNKGIICVGEENPEAIELFGELNLVPTDDYIYTSYPLWPEHTVNPYVTYTYQMMLTDAEELRYMHPDIIKTSSIGKSVEGRDLLLIEFGRGPKKIFVCGTHHAREYISTTYIMNAIDKYAYAYRVNEKWGKYDTREILDKVTFCIVPMVNPDGVNLVQNGLSAVTAEYAEWISHMGIYDGKKFGYRAWKANIRGVDVNWNYDKDWYITRNRNPRGSSGFNGEAPGIEPETIAVSKYVDSYPFEGFLSVHTQGQIFYWADNPQNPTGIEKAIKKDTGFIGYKEVPEGRGGSFFDYVYRKYFKPTVTIELCPYVGSYPYPDTQFATVWRPAKNIMLLFADTIIK